MGRGGEASVGAPIELPVTSEHPKVTPVPDAPDTNLAERPF